MRKTLYLKAKKEKKFRFYALYDRIYRKDVLAAAWTQVKRNGGTCGVDGVRIEMIRETPEREEAFLEEIHEQLRTKTSRRWNARPVSEVVVKLSRQVKGWSNYFDQGRNRPALRGMNDYIYKRMWKHLSRRSQRGYKPPKGQSWYEHLRHELGVIYL